MSPTPTVATRRVSAGTLQSDRRLHNRYPITLDGEYKLLYRRRVQRQGFCRTKNISSSGILLVLEDPPSNLYAIELTIKWPFLLGGSIPLKLMARGNIVRVAGNSIAVEVTEHEFHTAGHDQFKKHSQQ
jgi:hypothetical protein